MEFGPMAKTYIITRGRSAITGRIVKVAKAKADPTHHTVEKTKITKK